MIIIIPGKPIPLRRHRHTKSGSSYNSQRALMDYVSFVAREQYPFQPRNRPLKVHFKFFMPIPKKFVKSHTSLLENSPHDKVPDCSNLIKFYEDSLNGVIWQDDRLIVEISAVKLYSMKVRTEIEFFYY